MTIWIWRNLPCWLTPTVVGTFCRIGLHRYNYWTKADWYAESRSCEFCGRQEKT